MSECVRAENGGDHSLADRLGYTLGHWGAFAALWVRMARLIGPAKEIRIFYSSRSTELVICGLCCCAQGFFVMRANDLTILINMLGNF